MTDIFNRLPTTSFIIVCVFYAYFPAADGRSSHPIVVVLAFDGFRPDYTSAERTPVLDAFRRYGVRTDYLRNVFPTKTFVNFFSVATGLYAETHGVLGSSIFEANDTCINYSYELFHYDEKILPIWTLNELTGGGRHSGVMMWVGGEFPYRDTMPTFYQAYAKQVPWRQRVNTVMRWFTDKRTPINLLHMYFEQPDSDSHAYGIYSDQVNNQIRRVDEITAYFLRQLDLIGLRSRANIIILSDHGMVNLDRAKNIVLDDIIAPGTYQACGGSPVLQVLSKAGYEERTYDSLIAARDRLKTFDVYKPDQIPKRWHFRDNKRIFNTFVVSARIPYTFDSDDSVANHGYDNEDSDMHAFFTAAGPFFKRRFYRQSLLNIDIYPLIVYILKLETSYITVKPNGTLQSIASILNENVAVSYRDPSVQRIFKYFIPLSNYPYIRINR